MDLSRQASTFLEQEARALKTRLARVQPFVLFETAVPAAIPARETMAGIERFVARSRSELASALNRYVAGLRSQARQRFVPEQAQSRLTFLRLKFNILLSQFDLFADALTQRSEQDTGVWLAGLDEAAADALELEGGFYDPPPVLCYLDRGSGAAIRRARTRLPGGGRNPVAIIRIPRERMVGSGIAASLVHEVGHQGCALLDMVASMRPVLAAMRRKGGEERVAWSLWERWISEILADFWAVARLGITATIGLATVVSLPSSMEFRISESDPHPTPWVRLLLSAALGDALYPDPQWQGVQRLWGTLYPAAGLPPEKQRILSRLLATIPALASLIVNHRPKALGGRTLAEVMKTPDRQPSRLGRYYRAWRGSRQLWHAPPTLAFAVLGQARWNGWLSAEAESGTVASLLKHWALRRTLQGRHSCGCRSTGKRISRRMS